MVFLLDNDVCYHMIGVVQHCKFLKGIIYYPKSHTWYWWVAKLFLSFKFRHCEKCWIAELQGYQKHAGADSK